MNLDQSVSNPYSYTVRGLKATKIMRGGKPQADSMEGIFTTSRGLGFWGIYWVMKE